MKHKDKLCNHYNEILDGTYDCIDRIREEIKAINQCYGIKAAS